MKTNHGADADPLDRCYTPIGLARAVVDDLLARGILRPGMVACEPCAGAGSFVIALTERGIEVDAFDVDSTAPALLDAGDAVAGVRDFLTLPPDTYDIIVTNPPFSLAREFVAHGLRVAPIVSYLLPVMFEGTERYAQGVFDHYADRTAWAERPAFYGPGVKRKPGKDGKIRKSGGAQMSYATMTWRRDHEPGRDYAGRIRSWRSYRDAARISCEKG
jgi:hypothetical protein